MKKYKEVENEIKIYKHNLDVKKKSNNELIKYAELGGPLIKLINNKKDYQKLDFDKILRIEHNIELVHDILTKHMNIGLEKITISKELKKVFFKFRLIEKDIPYAKLSLALRKIITIMYDVLYYNTLIISPSIYYRIQDYTVIVDNFEDDLDIALFENLVFNSCLSKLVNMLNFNNLILVIYKDDYIINTIEGHIAKSKIGNEFTLA